MSENLGRPVLALEIAVTLGAGSIRSVSQPRFSPVLDMARTTRRHKCLKRIMRRSIVAGQARLVVYVCPVTCFSEMTQSTLIGKNSVRRGQGTASIYVISVQRRFGNDPTQRNDEHRDRQP